MQLNGNVSSNKTVPLCKPEVGEEELAAIQKVFSEGSLSHGPKVGEFERAFAKRIGVKHAIALNSCTSGLYLVCEYFREQHGPQEVLVPSFTFVASANSIACAGMKPKFVEVDWASGLVTPEILESQIGPHTRGIMVVHYAGRPCDMPSIMNLAKRNGLFVIEDSAECLGAKVGSQEAGSYGIGVFSFYSTKNITTGEGGMVTTNDDALASWLRLKLAHGIKKESYSENGATQKWYRNAVTPGHNFRLSNFQAAMGLVQLEKLDAFNRRRLEVAKQYQAGLSRIANLELPEIPGTDQHSFQMYAVKVPQSIRNRVLTFLNDHGVGASAHFDPPAHLQTAYLDKTLSLPITEKLARSTITLPISSTQSSEDTAYVVTTLKTALTL